MTNRQDRPDPWRSPVALAQIPERGLHREIDADEAQRKAMAEIGPEFGRPGGEGQRPCRRGEDYFLVTGRPASFQAAQPPSSALAFFHPA